MTTNSAERLVGKALDGRRQPEAGPWTTDRLNEDDPGNSRNNSDDSEVRTAVAPTEGSAVRMRKAAAKKRRRTTLGGGGEEERESKQLYDVVKQNDKRWCGKELEMPLKPGRTSPGDSTDDSAEEAPVPSRNRHGRRK